MDVGLVVGGWFASAAIAKLLEKLITYISKQSENRKGFRAKLKKLEKLKARLKVLNDIKGDADGAQIKDRKLQQWLEELREAVYDAEDVVDTFQYQVHASVSPTNTSVERMLVVVDSFETIFSKMPESLDLLKQDPVVSESRQTSSFFKPFQLLGRGQEKSRLLKLLRTDDEAGRSTSQSNFSIIAIVGMGGSGKTALAQNVFKVMNTRNWFHLKVWVWVSPTFDLKKIIKEVLSNLGLIDRLATNDSLDRIQTILSDSLKRKRFLIVLDDVWNLSSEDLENLCASFQSAMKGSRFILTTRNPGVVRRLDATIQTVSLEEMQERPYSVLFKRCAFRYPDNPGNSTLVSIGNKIAKKLKGSPLAAKTVGVELKSNPNDTHWGKILKSRLCDIKQGDSGILPSLRLTYLHLSAPLKQCFAFGALFPLNHIFERQSLVRMWIAQGFVQSSGNKNVEDTGMEYFDKLLDISFFQPAEPGNKNRYVINALLHEIAWFVSNTEYCVIENNNPVQMIPDQLRHLCVVGNTLPEVCKDEYKMKRLRSLVLLMGDVYLDRDYREMFSKLESLRLLIFSGYKGKLPSTIGNLKYLRYLHLSPRPTESTHLQSELFNQLYLLHGLNLQGRIYTPPRSRDNMISLQYLNASAEAISITAGIGRQTSLRELPEYTVKRNKEHKIGQLGELKELQGHLHIRCLQEVPGGEKEANKAKLDNKEHLKGLRLEWGDDLQGDINPPGSHGVLQGLKPHSNLQILEIAGYRGTRSPSWLVDRWLSKLTEIRLEKCKSWQDLPPLGQLPKLRVLHLTGLHGVKNIDSMFYGDEAFPSLEELSFIDIVKWEVWSQVKGRRLFPQLSKLCITGCPNLKGPLPLPSQLEGLIILLTASASSKEALKGSDNSSSNLLLCISDTSQLVGWLPAKNLSSLRKLEIRGFSQHSSFAAEEEWFKHCTSLQQLSFYHCRNLGSLPSQLKHLSSLKTLQITGCPKIKINPNPGLGLPTSLKQLFIHECHPELAQQCRNKQGRNWQQISTIPHVIILDSNSNVVYECSPSSSSVESSAGNELLIVLGLGLLLVLYLSSSGGNSSSKTRKGSQAPKGSQGQSYNYLPLFLLALVIYYYLSRCGNSSSNTQRGSPRRIPPRQSR